MWIEPEHLARWGGPTGLTFSIIRMDVRPAGAYRFNRREVNGTDHWSQGIYREIVPPQRLVFTTGWTHAEGNATSAQTLLTRLSRNARARRSWCCISRGLNQPLHAIRIVKAISALWSGSKNIWPCSKPKRI
jgi:uncharacterized protein YndB with AHSA1/START domain